LSEDLQTLSTDQPIPLPPKKKKPSSKDSTEELVGLATQYFKKSETESDFIAKGWCLKLTRLNSDQRCFAEKIINDTLFEAEMGTLTRHGVVFLTSSQSVLTPSSSQTTTNIRSPYYSSSCVSSSPSPTSLLYSRPSSPPITHITPNHYVSPVNYTPIQNSEDTVQEENVASYLSRFSSF
jgi:hypothetical protein